MLGAYALGLNPEMKSKYTSTGHDEFLSSVPFSEGFPQMHV